MPRPSVEIVQEILNAVVVPADPELSTCLVGPAYGYADYPADKAAADEVWYGGRPGFSATVATRGFSAGGSEMQVPFAANASYSAPLAAFGAEVGKHLVHELLATDAERARLYLEEVYISIADDVGGDVQISDTRTLTGSSGVEFNGVVDGDNDRPGAGDVAVLAFQLAQVIYDSGVDFIAQGAIAGDKVVLVDTVAPNASLNGNTFIVKKVLDANRILLEENVGGNLVSAVAEGQNGLADNHPIGYSLTTSGDVERFARAEADGAALIRPAPLAVPIRNIDAAGVVTLMQDVPYITSDSANCYVKVRIERKLGNWSSTQPGWPLPEGEKGIGGRTDTAVQAHAAGFILSVNGSDFAVTRARVFASWRGLIVDQPDILTIGSVPASGEFPSIGRISPRNPLALATSVCLANSGGNTIKVLALAAPGSAGFTAARPKINSSEDIYTIVPLSTDLSGVIAEYKSDAVTLSKPEKSMFRIVIGAAGDLPVSKQLSAGSCDTFVVGQNTDRLFDEDATFVSAGVAPGDRVTLDNGATADVVTVVNEQNVLVNNHVNAAGEAANDNWAAGVSYTLDRSIADNQEAQKNELIAQISSVADKRLVMVYPGSCTARGFTNQPGYYIAAALGGVVSSTDAHRPKNNLGIAGIDQVFDSNLHFSDDQIDALGDGGWFVFVQDSVSGLPYTPHQVTTGQASMPGVQEFAELSVVTNFDFVSKIMKTRLDPYVGVWNIIPQAFGSIRSSLEGGIDDLRSRRSPRIGAPLISGSVLEVQQNAGDAGRLDISMEVQLPKVLNKLKLHLVSV